MKGKIYLMAAGHGDHGLLSAQALHVLRTSEVVLHDEQVSPELLRVVPASAQVRNVHRLDILTGTLQDKILSLLVSAARDGHQVLRLKAHGSRPSASSDGEVEALNQAGIDFEVIVGTEAALAAAAGAN